MNTVKGILILLLTFFAVSLTLAQNVKKVVVLDPAGNLMESIETMIREELNNNAIRSKEYVAIEKSPINKAIAESGYIITGQVDLDKISALGKTLGADLICHTTATTLGPNYYIACKLIDVSTAKEVKENTGITKEGLSDLFKVVSTIGNSFFPNQEIVENQVVSTPVVQANIQTNTPVAKSTANVSNLSSINVMGNKLFIMQYDVVSERVTWYVANSGCQKASVQGFDDWRLPTKNEISQMYLQKHSVSGMKPYWYWSSTGRGNDYYRQAFDADKLALADADARLHVRCVRGGVGAGSSHVSLNHLGNEFIIMTTDVVYEKVTWADANAACLNSTTDGFDDWRLPSKDEISKMFLNKELIGNTKPYWYWSSTNSREEYYRQAFDANKLVLANPEARIHARCVRSTKSKSKLVLPSINIAGTEVVVMPSDIVEEKKIWSEANDVCLNADAYGHKDWRLPTQNEIKQLYLNKATITNMKSYWYWSSTKGEKGYFRQAFDANKMEEAKQKDISNIRCVRSAK